MAKKGFNDSGYNNITKERILTSSISLLRLLSFSSKAILSFLTDKLSSSYLSSIACCSFWNKVKTYQSESFEIEGEFSKIR